MPIPQDKVDEFIKQLNLRLPFKVSAHARPSEQMPNVTNVLIVQEHQIVEAYGLSETNGVVHWFENSMGRFY